MAREETGVPRYGNKILHAWSCTVKAQRKFYLLSNCSTRPFCYIRRTCMTIENHCPGPVYADSQTLPSAAVDRVDACPHSHVRQSTDKMCRPGTSCMMAPCTVDAEQENAVGFSTMHACCSKLRTARSIRSRAFVSVKLAKVAMSELSQLAHRMFLCIELLEANINFIRAIAKSVRAVQQRGCNRSSQAISTHKFCCAKQCVRKA